MATAVPTAPAAPTAPASDAPSARRWLARHPFVLYALRRFAVYILTVWGALTIAFLFYRLIPGDPILSFMASLEQQYGFQQSASQEIIDHYREVFGLNGNLFQQYLRYLYQTLVTRDLGPALIDFPTPAQVVIARTLPWTIGLLGFSIAISWVIGILLGAFAAWKRNSYASQTLTNVALTFAFVPGYFIALIVLMIFAYRLAWLPSSAAYDPHFEKGFSWDFIRSVIQHGTLPAFSIAFGFACRDLLSARMLVVTTLGEDYLTFAEAKGLRPLTVMLRYAVRNVYLPQVTALAIQLGFIFGGTFIIESIFNYPGVGNLFVNAIRILDFNTVQGIISMSIVGVLTANFLVDLMLPTLDPRVKYWHSMPRSFLTLWRASGKFRVGLLMLAVLIVFALLGDVISAMVGQGKDPLELSAYNAWLVPSAAHPLGTDRSGRDILVMTAIGLRASLQIGLIAGVFSTAFGVVVAFVAGYKGGRIDDVLRTATDFVLVMPSLPLLITLSAYQRNISLLQVSAMLAIFSWPFAARTVRAQVLSLRSRPYVELARATKLSDREIIFEELMPNLLPYIGVGMASASVASIVALAALEIIGLGPSDALDLGLMISWAVSWGALSLGAWPIIVAPIFILSALFVAVNLINFGLEEIYNPRLRAIAGA